VEAEQGKAGRRLAQARKEAAFLAALRDARERRATWVGKGFDLKGGSEAYARAFDTYGRDVTKGAEAEAAAWVKGLPEEVREAALIALYDWWDKAPEAELSVRLWKIVERADDDLWRRRFREAARTKGHGLLQELTREAWARPLPAVSYVLMASLLVREGRKGEAADLLRRAQLLHPRDFWIPFSLGNLLNRSNLLNDLSGPPPGAAELVEAAGCYRTALAIRPESHAGLNNLGIVLCDQGKFPEAIAACQEAIRLKPDFAEAHNSLGLALLDQGKLAEAAAAFKEAVRLRPDLPAAHTNLGNAMQRQGKLAEAVAAYRKAIRLKHDYPGVYFNLGKALRAQGKPAEAAAAYREAIRLKHDFPQAHTNLGNALADQGKLAEAVAAYRKALDLKPDYPEAHSNFGAALCRQGKLPEAVAACQEAIRLKHDCPEAHCDLGYALFVQGKLAEAVAASKEAIRLRPDYFYAHFLLGSALADQGKPAEAVAAYKEAIRFRPDYPNAHCNLGHALHQLGRFAESLDALRRGHELGAKTPGWRYPSSQWVRDAERLVALDEKLPAILKDDARPADVTEQILLAQLCETPAKRLYAAAARFYAAAFAARPDLTAGHRYDAACCAALAGSGQGQDDPKPDDKERTRLRAQALEWLRADLAAWAKRVEGGMPADRAAAVGKLTRWQKDDDLAGVRHPWALLRLPADERRPWQQLWADVDALLKRAQSKDSR
jgi:tetratricopeptide (TPR) repeat protein